MSTPRAARSANAIALVASKKLASSRSGWPNTSRSPAVGPRLHLMRLPCRSKRKRQASSKVSRRPLPVAGRPCAAAAGRSCPAARCAAPPRRPSHARAGTPPSGTPRGGPARSSRSEEHTSELQSQSNLVCRLLLEKKKKKRKKKRCVLSQPHIHAHVRRCVTVVYVQ